jgi:hypothetical protein
MDVQHCVYICGLAILYYSIHSSQHRAKNGERKMRWKREREKKSAGMHSLSLCRNAKQLQIYASIIFDEFI